MEGLPDVSGERDYDLPDCFHDCNQSCTNADCTRGLHAALLGRQIRSSGSWNGTLNVMLQADRQTGRQAHAAIVASWLM